MPTETAKNGCSVAGQCLPRKALGQTELLLVLVHRRVVRRAFMKTSPLVISFRCNDFEKMNVNSTWTKKIGSIWMPTISLARPSIRILYSTVRQMMIQKTKRTRTTMTTTRTRTKTVSQTSPRVQYRPVNHHLLVLISTTVMATTTRSDCPSHRHRIDRNRLFTFTFDGLPPPLPPPHLLWRVPRPNHNTLANLPRLTLW